MMEKELTFIMPTYNSASYLKRTLKSVEQMIGTYDDKVEILFVDDGSTDETVELLEKEVQHKNNYRFLVTESWRSQPSAKYWPQKCTREICDFY